MVLTFFTILISLNQHSYSCGLKVEKRRQKIGNILTIVTHKSFASFNCLFLFLSFSFMKWQNLFRFHTFLPYSSFQSVLLHLLCFWFSLNFATFSYLFHFSWKVCNTKNMVSYRPSFHFRRFSLRNKSWRIEKFRKNRVCEKIKCVRYLHQVIAKSKDRKLFL